jgi:hypothetical protein
MIYHRRNMQVFFILPTIACGTDIDGKYFLEAAWFFFVIGIGEKYEY